MPFDAKQESERITELASAISNTMIFSSGRDVATKMYDELLDTVCKMPLSNRMATAEYLKKNIDTSNPHPLLDGNGEMTHLDVYKLTIPLKCEDK